MTPSAADILAFETKVADKQWTTVERRQIDKLYNPAKASDLATLAPGFDWAGFLAGAQVSDDKPAARPAQAAPADAPSAGPARADAPGNTAAAGARNASKPATLIAALPGASFKFFA